MCACVGFEISTTNSQARFTPHNLGGCGAIGLMQSPYGQIKSSTQGNTQNCEHEKFSLRACFAFYHRFANGRNGDQLLCGVRELLSVPITVWPPRSSPSLGQYANACMNTNNILSYDLMLLFVQPIFYAVVVIVARSLLCLIFFCTAAADRHSKYPETFICTANVCLIKIFQLHFVLFLCCFLFLQNNHNNNNKKK